MGPAFGMLLAGADLNPAPVAPKTAAPAPAKGINPNPFKGKTAQEIDAMLKAKGYQPRGPDPLNGKGGYVNPETGRSYHIDSANSYGEPAHVDVNRPRGYNGPLDKSKFSM
jgi:hypothetical protein